MQESDFPMAHDNASSISPLRPDPMLLAALLRSDNAGTGNAGVGCLSGKGQGPRSRPRRAGSSCLCRSRRHRTRMSAQRLGVSIPDGPESVGSGGLPSYILRSDAVFE